MRLRSTKIRRNEKCPCGSGKKLKHCCLGKVKALQAATEAGIDPQTLICDQIFGVAPSEPQ